MTHTGGGNGGLPGGVISLTRVLARVYVRREMPVYRFHATQ